MRLAHTASPECFEVAGGDFFDIQLIKGFGNRTIDERRTVVSVPLFELYAIPRDAPVWEHIDRSEHRIFDVTHFNRVFEFMLRE